jgi:hypothetical protein
MNRILIVLSLLFSFALVGCIASPAYADEPPASSSVVVPPDVGVAPATLPAALEPTVSPTPAVPVVNIDADPVGYASNTYGAAKAGKWLVFVGFVIIGLVYFVRRWGSKLIPWIATDRGGVATALVCGFLASLASTAISSGSISGSTLIVAAEQAVAAIGGFVILKKLIFPSDAKA